MTMQVRRQQAARRSWRDNARYDERLSFDPRLPCCLSNHERKHLRLIHKRPVIAGSKARLASKSCIGSRTTWQHCLYCASFRLGFWARETVGGMAVQTIQLSHLEGYPVHVGLFEDVQNAAFLRQQLLDGNAEFEYAFLDATTVREVSRANPLFFLSPASDVDIRSCLQPMS